MGMTNQQAIDLLSHTYFPCGSDIGAAIAKAIEAMKAQEPRVMTLDEALDSLVIEYRNGKLQVVGKLIFTNGYKLYGNIWRVWDRMPTDEQREATPWH